VSNKMLTVLSDQEQELLTGGADFELAASNYGNKGSILMGTSASGPHGSTASSAGKANTILTAGQDFLGLGTEPPAGVRALGPAVLPTTGNVPAITPPIATPGTPVQP
jgi:hypothetical protein